jgi:hypothetical protein
MMVAIDRSHQVNSLKIIALSGIRTHPDPASVVRCGQMNALLESNTGQNAAAIPCLEKLAVCANEPQKLLIPKELHPQNNSEIPSKTPKIPEKTPQKAKKNGSRTPENRCHQRLSPATSDKHRDGPIHRLGPRTCAPGGAPIAPFAELFRHPEPHLIDRDESRLNRTFQRTLKNIELLRQIESTGQLTQLRHRETKARAPKTANYQTNLDPNNHQQNQRITPQHPLQKFKPISNRSFAVDPRTAISENRRNENKWSDPEN